MSEKEKVVTTDKNAEDCPSCRRRTFPTRTDDGEFVEVRCSKCGHLLELLRWEVV